MSDQDRSSRADDERERPIKVTDRRMFTPAGELREEYRHVTESAASRPAATASAQPAPPRPAQPPAAPTPAARSQAARSQAAPSPAASSPAAPAGYPEPGMATGEPEPGFLDLVAMLAEPASIYLQRARVVDGQSSQNLELARLHIELLATLEKKTRGNLDFQEKQLLDDALHQLRLAYVETAG